MPGRNAPQRPHTIDGRTSRLHDRERETRRTRGQRGRERRERAAAIRYGRSDRARPGAGRHLRTPALRQRADRRRQPPGPHRSHRHHSPQWPDGHRGLGEAAPVHRPLRQDRGRRESRGRGRPGRTAGRPDGAVCGPPRRGHGRSRPRRQRLRRATPCRRRRPRTPSPTARQGTRRRAAHGPPVRRARLRRTQLVPRRGTHHLGLRRPTRARTARTRRRPLPRVPLLRGRLLRLRTRPRTGPHGCRPALQTAGAPHPAAVLRRRLRNREGIRDARPRVHPRLRRPPALPRPHAASSTSPCGPSNRAPSPAYCW